MNDNNLCSVIIEIILDRKLRTSMDNKENPQNKQNKVTETLIKELEGLSNEGLHDFFIFFYRLNHYQGNMMVLDRFEEFLESFEDNPFKVNEDKNFRKQLIDNIVKFSFDHMSLLTAAILIKKKFTIEEVAANYYSNIDVFDTPWF